MEFKVSEHIKTWLSENYEIIKNLNNSEIAKILLKEDNLIKERYNNKFETLRKILWKIRGKVNISISNQPKELKTPYKVIGDKHFFYPIKGSFSISNELVDKLFYSFSKHGLDLSQTQIINKYNLEPWQWHAIKNALKLYKLSNIFSPHTIENTDPETMKQMVKEKLDQRINTLGYIIEDEYNKSIIKKYKDVIKQSTVKDLEINTLITEIQDLLPKIEIEAPINSCTCKNVNYDGGEITLVISDIHFGLNNANEEKAPNFSVSKVREILFSIADEVNKYNASKVNVINLGDIIETFQGNNHIGSWKGIETGYYGSRLVIECYKLFIEFLIRINNLSSYSQIPGNHDRSSSDNKEDTEGFISRIVFEFIKNSFVNSNIEFTYDNILISKKIGNINYIASHGHLGISKMQPSELILEYAIDPKSYTILLQGHLHDRKVKRDHKMFRDIIVPAIMPGNNYSVTSGFSGCPGFLVIKERNLKPVVIDYSL